MKILLFGGSGLLGSDFYERVTAEGHEVIAPPHAMVDVTDETQVAAALADAKPDWCLNCVAYTAVDQAETDIDAASHLNIQGAAIPARACFSHHTKYLLISTDFVFDGTADHPYTESDEPAPVGIYGQSKRLGELAAGRENPSTLVVRTSWLYGARGKCFPTTILNAHTAGRLLRVVADQRGNPTHVWDLAFALLELMQVAPAETLLHLAGPETMSWHEFARRILREAGHPGADVLPISSLDWPTPAPRPAFSALDSVKAHHLGVSALPMVDDSIRSYLSRRDR